MMLVLVGGKPPQEGSAAQGTGPISLVVEKLKLIGTQLRPQLRAGKTLSDLAAQVISFLPKVFDLPIAFLSVVSKENAGGEAVLAETETNSVSLNDLRLLTPETLGGKAMADGIILYLPDLDTNGVVKMDLRETRKMAAGREPCIVRANLAGVIPTMEETAVSVFQGKGAKSILLAPLGAGRDRKVLLVAGFSAPDRTNLPQETILLLVGLFQSFSIAASSKSLM
ncbi:MAG: hypothetical protein NT099_01785 [Candidatus Saganbacteria bacterium]|nr:hypothetical protein [Candidatus Saganbacteria bacterium]